MSLLPYPLLVSDIDGTLVNGHKEISVKNIHSIDLYRRLGGMFTIATGRSYFEAKRFIHQLKINIPVILYNGAVMYEPFVKSLYPLQTMERDVMMEIIKEIGEKLPPSIDLFAYGLDSVYAVKVGPLAQAGLDDTEDFHIELIPTFAHIPEQTCIKVIAVANPEEMKLLSDWAKTATHFPVDFVASSDHYFEILPTGVSKGKAVQILLERLQLSSQQAAAIGDHLNDISMLRAVGLSAAVSNAHPATLQSAKVTVPSNNEDGVAYFIRHHLLQTIPQANTP